MLGTSSCWWRSSISINLPTRGTFDVKLEIATIAMVEEASFATPTAGITICMLALTLALGEGGCGLDAQGVVSHGVTLRMTCGGRRCNTESICKQDRIPIYRTQSKQLHSRHHFPTLPQWSRDALRGYNVGPPFLEISPNSLPFSLLHSPAHDRKVINWQKSNTTSTDQALERAL